MADCMRMARGRADPGNLSAGGGKINMTPLEKAKAAAGRVNYCDECESFVILNGAPYCKVDGKLIHPIMLVRGQGTGPAWNCKKKNKAHHQLRKADPKDAGRAGTMYMGCPERNKT